jgi:hypothetical protein
MEVHLMQSGLPLFILLAVAQGRSLQGAGPRIESGTWYIVLDRRYAPLSFFLHIGNTNFWGSGFSFSRPGSGKPEWSTKKD